MGNYDCCEECRRNCEGLAAVDLEDDKSTMAALYYDSRMGHDAYVWAIPPVVKYMLSRPNRENWESVRKIFASRRREDLSDSQESAIAHLMEYVNASAGLGYFPSEYLDC